MAAVLFASACVQGGCRAEQPWPLWDAYANRFIDKQGRVIDHSGQDRTTTEGQAYAMFFALVAGDRSRFDKLVEWTEDNLAQGDLTAHLPAWSWGKASDGGWRVLDPNPAADADLWMAYALCEAGRLWQFERYEKLGDLMAMRVAQQEVVLVPGVGTTLLPGAQGFHPDPNTWYVNPSYLPPPLLAYFAKREPGQPWGEVLESLPQIVHSNGGFVMDWVSATPQGVRPSLNPALLAAGAQAGATPAAPMGSFDAIRVYLWMGLADRNTPGVKESLDQMRGMAFYVHAHLLPPSQVDANGHVLNSDSPPGFSAAVIPYLQALGLKDDAATQAKRLAALKDAKSGLYGRDGLYYDQNLALFATGWSEGRFRFDSEGRLRLKWK
jgi:endoglucanase